ncbi:MAG: SPOR domain-containing protein [Bacteroidales bacterium]|nr:SPOR domain-containing protein [Bacteroidales bacterium]
MINFKTIFSIFILLIFNLVVFGQTAQSQSKSNDIFSSIQEKEQDQGDVLIFQDIRVNELVSNHIEQNKRKGGVSGYRIRIYSNLGNTARDQSQVTKAKFYELFPEIPIYREYDSPYFKVYVGDFRSKIDAMADFKRIKRYFPSAFIVPDKINYPSLEDK